MKSPAELLLSLLVDTKRLEPGAKGLDRDIITVKKRIENEGDGFLTVALPSLCEALDRGLAQRKFACPRGFKPIPGGTIPRFLSGMFCKVFDSLTGTLLENPDISAVKSIRQLTRVFKKLLLSDDQEEVLDRKAKLQFMVDDDACSEAPKFSERESFIFHNVCRYLLSSLDTFDERELVGKHGPGAVFEQLMPNQKWEALCTFSSALERMGYDVFLSQSGEIHGGCTSQSVEFGASGDQARLITVPKNTSSRRTITVEPVVRMFVQQAYNTLLRDHIPKCRVLGQCLDLNDQTPNQNLALESSRTGEYATLDLKSASDRLSLHLVRLVFESKPQFLRGILECRTPSVLIGEDRFELKKYAGMGNATTFPVQSVVFAALAIAALVEDLRPSYRNVRQVARSVRVFGDDIIVPSDKVHQVVSWLTKAGLTVNLGKSFTEGNFRESCGVDAFNGINVTPFYVKRHPGNASKKEPSILASYVSLANQAWFAGYYTLATKVQEFVEGLLRRRLPLVASTSGALGWHTRQDCVEFQRWSETLHRFEVKAPVLVSVKRRDKLDGYAALLKFYHRQPGQKIGSLDLPSHDGDGDHLMKSPLRFKLRIVSRWVPV